jgi:protein ImuB
LKRIGDLYAMPRDALTRRFGEIVARRLDQARGDLPEPLSPLDETPARRVRLSFAEPIADPADLALATERLTEDLVTRLAREGAGARRLVLAFHRVDGRVERLALGTARPSRDPCHLATLFKERLGTIDPGPGVEDVILAAFAVDSLGPEQIELAGSSASERTGSIAALLDRLGNRFGLAAVSRLEARESHIPERSWVWVSAALPSPTQPSLAMRERVLSSARRIREQKSGAGIKPPRPIRLFDPPEPVEASWLLPDDPPFRFTWRRRAHRVSRADGPERIAEEWWRSKASVAGPRESLPRPRSGDGDAIRDYYQVEDEEGRRFWLFRAGLPGDGHPPRWYVHGIFA